MKYLYWGTITVLALITGRYLSLYLDKTIPSNEQVFSQRLEACQKKGAKYFNPSIGCVFEVPQ